MHSSSLPISFNYSQSSYKPQWVSIDEFELLYLFPSFYPMQWFINCVNRKTIISLSSCPAPPKLLINHLFFSFRPTPSSLMISSSPVVINVIYMPVSPKFVIPERNGFSEFHCELPHGCQVGAKNTTQPKSTSWSSTLPRQPVPPFFPISVIQAQSWDSCSVPLSPFQHHVSVSNTVFAPDPFSQPLVLPPGLGTIDLPGKWQQPSDSSYFASKGFLHTPDNVLLKA